MRSPLKRGNRRQGMDRAETNDDGCNGWPGQKTLGKDRGREIDAWKDGVSTENSREQFKWTLRHTAGQENEKGDLGREAERQRVLDRVRAANITTEH